MRELTDKTTVVTELEDWRDKIKKGIFSIPLTGSDRAYATFEYEILGKVKDLLDTLEVKEVEEEPVRKDLEEEIDKELHENWYGEYINLDKFRESANHFYELGLKAQKGD